MTGLKPVHQCYPPLEDTLRPPSLHVVQGSDCKKGFLYHLVKIRNAVRIIYSKPGAYFFKFYRASFLDDFVRTL